MQLPLCFMAVAGLLCPTVLAQGPEKRRTGNVCSQDQECPDNAFCRSGSYCVCKDGYIYVAMSDTQKVCLKVGMYGDACEKNIQCNTMMGIHSECRFGSCSCKNDTKLVGDRCYTTSVIGQRCVVSNNCFLADGDEDPSKQAFCVRGLCTCALESSPRDNGTRCVRDAKLGEPCEDNEQCAGVGLECSGTCHCREGYAPHNYTNICMKYVTALEDPCEYDVQCESLVGGMSPRDAAFCLDGKCICSFNARATGTPERCWLSRLPGQECHRDEECISEEGDPGYCLDGRCTCKNCVPDDRDFGGSATIALSFPLATILMISAILA